MKVDLTKEEAETLINLLTSYASPIDKSQLLYSALEKFKKEYDKV